MEYQKEKSYLKRCYAEVHLDRLEKNILSYKSYIKDRSDICCVVKADAYGHCVEAVAPFLQDKLGISWFAVSNLYEAIELRRLGIKGEILILSSTPADKAELLNEYDLITALPSVEYAKSLSEQGVKVRVHLKIDTGMSRIGFNCRTAAEEIAEISGCENIEVEGIFTHLCVADSEADCDKEFTQEQIRRFKSVCEDCERNGMKFRRKHYLNSAGGVYYYSPESSLVRLGIIQYGLMPSYATPLPFEVKPVMELKAYVTQVKEIEAGESVSYGRTFVADRRIKVATIPCGYADGYFRLLSNTGEVEINGRRARILGRVCMDQMMVDCTDIEVKTGDIATLFGESLTADELGDRIGTIGYELVCAVSKRVPRVICYNGERGESYL